MLHPEDGGQDSNESAYYYLSRVQRPSSISKCVLASFTCSPGAQLAEESKMCDVSGQEGQQPAIPAANVVDKNIIFAQSDYVRVFTVRSDGKSDGDDGGAGMLQLHSEFSVNDRILDILPVPTDQFDGQNSAVMV